MSRGKLHADEVDTDIDLVRRLIAAQFPRWADLPIRPVESDGTDNAIYRLGNDFSVRLPLVANAAEQVHKEQRWLPVLAPLLPLAIPVPVAKGLPAEGFPWSWSVYRWLEGENPTAERIADPHGVATELARFITALHGIDPAGGPSPGRHNFHRGNLLSTRDSHTRKAIAAHPGPLDRDAVTRAWDMAVRAPEWDRPPVWVHGDLIQTNLICQRDRLTGVIDFGGLGVGDPACDLLAAWTFLPADARGTFRAALSVDDATWERGRGWALSTALIAIPYYYKTNPVIARRGQRSIDAVLAEA